MKIAVLRERKEGERRVAVTPDMARKYIALGARVAVESGAGEGASFTDGAYQTASAWIAKSLPELLESADIVLCVQPPEEAAVAAMKDGAILIGMLDPYRIDGVLSHYSQKGLSAFALELLPRISRAQSMDVLSSQSNLAGYRAVIEAVAAMKKAVPMMMTAAGTIAPAKALILGAGVAGLQAIATARRLGAIVSAFDVRPVAKEQVESLGAKFIEVPAEHAAAETKGGYAREMSEEYKKRQQQLIGDTIRKQDIVITTALIPGKPAPVLITEEMVQAMKPGSVIVDMAVGAGGNCVLSEYGQTVEKHGVTLVGHANLPSQVSLDASALYARNLYTFITTLLLSKEGALAPQWEDELVIGTMLTRDGQAVHAMLKG